MLTVGAFDRTRIEGGPCDRMRPGFAHPHLQVRNLGAARKCPGPSLVGRSRDLAPEIVHESWVRGHGIGAAAICMLVSHHTSQTLPRMRTKEHLLRDGGLASRQGKTINDPSRATIVYGCCDQVSLIQRLVDISKA